jgi:hypothetical protein
MGRESGIVDARLGVVEPGRVLHGVIIALAALVAALFTRPAAIDDAYICFRYARHLAHGQGLVMNVGERVEGVSNLLWTVLLAPVAALGHDALPRAAVIAGVVLLALAGLRLWQLNARLGGPRGLGLLAALVLLLDLEVVAGLANGLEGALFALLLVEVLYRYVGGAFTAAGVAVGLLFATRPEGLLMGVLLMVTIACDHRERALSRAAIPWLAIVGGITAFRLLYFGSLLPNPVFAKSAGLGLVLGSAESRAAIRDYGLGFLHDNPQLAALSIAAALAPFLGDGAPKRRVGVLCLGGIVGSWAVMVANGGDWMPHFRLLAQYAPLYAAALLLVPSSARAVGVSGAGVVGLTVLGIHGAEPRALALDLGGDGPPPLRTTLVARLRPRLSTGDVVSAEAIGYIGYALPDTPIHDPLGLTDAYLARHGHRCLTYGKMDVGYTLGRVRPAVAAWHYLGHVLDAPPAVLEAYTIFCPTSCEEPDANGVMVRNDRLTSLGTAFADWTIVHVEGGAMRSVRGPQ